jgi:integrase/recombinase XerD
MTPEDLRALSADLHARTPLRYVQFINIKLSGVDFHYCQIWINKGKGSKDRIVPFPQLYKEMLAMHADSMRKKQAVYLFESLRKRKYTDRGIRKILAKYSEEAGLAQNFSPHKLRHFLLTWVKKQGIDDALIQPYSGHESRKLLEVYSKLAITDAQQEYSEPINKFPI